MIHDLLTRWVAQASGHAAQVDAIMAGFVALAVLLSAPVFVLMAWFAIKYRRGKTADRVDPRHRNIWLEISWALLPFALILVFYVWATRLFIDLHNPPPGAIEIAVVAKQWMWKFQHPGGQREIDELHVPAGQPVKLILASQDVIHSLYVPALRLKQDAVPGRYTTMWFVAERPGAYELACAEFCGANHSLMRGQLIVQTPADHARWLERADVDRSLAQEGEALFRSRGCSGCHGPSSTVHAPPLAGLYGRLVPLESGETVVADDQYIRDSILLPQSQIAAGYPHVMPTYRNVLSEDELLRLVAYVKSLRGEERPQ